MDLQYRTNGPEFDFPEYREVPSVCYVIASTPRSGSNMLQRGLWHTGLAGFPEEYFADAYVADFAKRWQTLPTADLGRGGIDVGHYLEMLMRFRTSPNGVFGLKVHPAHLRSRALTGMDIDQVLRGPRYVWIQRTDRVRQAISYYRAETSGVWIEDGIYLPKTTSRGPAAYSFALIQRYLEAVEQDVAFWESFFRDRRLEPHIVKYGDLVENYSEVMAACLAYLGIPRPKGIPEPGIARQADEITDEWHRRFVADLSAAAGAPAEFSGAAPVDGAGVQV